MHFDLWNSLLEDIAYYFRCFVLQSDTFLRIIKQTEDGCMQASVRTAVERFDAEHQE